MKPASAKAGTEQAMLNFSTTYPGKKNTAPKWSENIDDRIAWCCWFLENNPSVYETFKVIADARVFKNPDKRISSEGIVNALRYDTNVRADGDQYAINSNAKPLLARLYQLERPNAKLDSRNSWLDHLDPCEWKVILDAWRSADGSSS